MNRPCGPRRGLRGFPRPAAALAVALLSGCSSGIPRFVKYTADSRYILAADAWYDRCHIHDVRAGKTRSFAGSFICEDPSGPRWMIEPASGGRRKRLRLVTADETSALTVTRLPLLPEMPRRPAIRAAFGPEDGQISLILCREGFFDPDWRAFRLTIGEESWRRVEAESERTALREHVEGRPKDLLRGYSRIAPSASSFWMQGDQGFIGGEGQNVRAVREPRDPAGGRHEYRLPSPDAETVVSIKVEQPRAVWARGWGEVKLTHKQTGAARALMSNTDLLLRIWHNHMYGPCVFAARPPGGGP
jgi:hypothetical protein